MRNSKILITKERVVLQLKNKEDTELYNIKMVDNFYVSEPDKDNMYIVGCPDREKFIKIPQVAVEIINHIISNCNIIDITSVIDEEIDYRDFIFSLVRLGFIDQIGDYQIVSQDIDKKRIGLKLKSKYLNVPYINHLFSRNSIIIAFISLPVTFLLKIIEYRSFNQSVLPSIKDFEHLPNLLYLYLLFYLSDLILGFYHETSHALTARYFGIRNININLGRRLIHLVYQTQIPNIWSVNKRKRSLIYLSGIIADCILISFTIIIGHIFLQLNFTIAFYISRIITLFLLLGILFEFKLYMRTDIYYLLSDRMGLPNLHQDSINLIKHLKQWLTTDYRIRIYTVIMLLSSTIEIFIFLKFILPFTLFAFNNLKKLHLNYPQNTLDDYGNLLAIFLIFIELSFLIFLFLKEKKYKTINSQL